MIDIRSQDNDPNDINKQEYFTKTLSILGKNNKTDEKIIKNLCNQFTIKEITGNN